MLGRHNVLLPLQGGLSVYLRTARKEEDSGADSRGLTLVNYIAAVVFTTLHISKAKEIGSRSDMHAYGLCPLKAALFFFF